MLIHSLDLGKRCGWAIGRAGEVPNSGFLLLRKPKQSIAHATFNLRSYLETLWSKQRPDLVVFEAPMSLAAWVQNAKRTGRMHNAESHEHLIKLANEIETTAYANGLPSEPIHRISVMWKITNKQSWGSYARRRQRQICALSKHEFRPFRRKLGLTPRANA